MSTSNLTRETAEARSAAIDLDTIEVWLDLTGAVTAEQTMFPSRSTLRFTSTVDQIGLDFLDGEVEQVQVNGQIQPVDHDGATITVTGLATDGSTNEVTVTGRARYSRSGQGLHRFTDPADGQTFVYTQYEPTDSRRVYAQFDQPDLKAEHIFHVTAPAEWVVLSNQPEVARQTVDAAAQSVRHDFAPTPKLSTYLTAVIAGPYHLVRDQWTSPDGQLSVELGLACRASRAETMDVEELFRLTRAGLDFYHENFGYPYPWGKYDQVFVPEYNLGAMENPGCVTFTEDYLFRSAATRAQFAGRSNTIQHEMAHMWFGDLVTPRWWDELWLKESFAEYMGSHVNAEAAGFPEAWVGFAGRRKAWAYGQDELPTTHPIAADIADVEAAKQNFDGITYAKGASVLKQLVHHVGVEAFFAGSRLYFQRHAFAATSFSDLVAALTQASGKDLSDWTHAWLETAGPDVLTSVLEVDERGLVTRAMIEQHSVDPLTGEQVRRPHTLAVGLYDLGEDALLRRERLNVELSGEGTELDLAGQPAPDLMLVNDEDWTYARVVMDQRSVTTALAHLSALDDPLARALVWSQLWLMTRDGLLPVRDYVRAVETHAASETESSTLGSLLANAHEAIETYLPQASRSRARDQHFDALWDLLRGAEAGSDTQLALARAVASQAAVTPASSGRLEGLLAHPMPMVTLDTELRWHMVRALAALGVLDEFALFKELQRDKTMDGELEQLAAKASLPLKHLKTQILDQVRAVGGYSNAQVDAALVGLRQPVSRHLLAEADAQYFDGLVGVWAEHSIEMAQRLVRGLFPVASADVVVAARSWLEANPQAPRALRRIILEETDRADRAVRVQRVNR